MRTTIVSALRNPLLFAAATVATLAPTAAAVAQEKTIGTIADTAKNSVSPVVQLGVAGFFAAGLYFFGLGLFKIKQASSDDGRTKYSEGAMKMAIGAGLMALAPMINVILGTAGVDPANMDKAVWE